MIKLIASDMDGTLLNDRKELPGDFFEVFDELERRGIKFTVASGRSFDAVAHLFPEEYRTRLDFICDNGANVIHEGKQVSVTPLDRPTFEQLIARVFVRFWLNLWSSMTPSRPRSTERVNAVL